MLAYSFPYGRYAAIFAAIILILIILDVLS